VSALSKKGCREGGKSIIDERRGIVVSGIPREGLSARLEEEVTYNDDMKICLGVGLASKGLASGELANAEAVLALFDI
jgi:hypothetical protein